MLFTYADILADWVVTVYLAIVSSHLLGEGIFKSSKKIMLGFGDYVLSVLSFGFSFVGSVCR